MILFNSALKEFTVFVLLFYFLCGYQQRFQVNPYLEAIIELNLDALDIAKRLDDERWGGKTRGRLHGIPVLVKDVSGKRPPV